jgi:hypothetical protein
MRKSDVRKVLKYLAGRGGRAALAKRKKNMTPEQRSERARRMVNARWHPNLEPGEGELRAANE